MKDNGWGTVLVMAVVFLIIVIVALAVDSENVRKKTCISAFAHAKTPADTLNVIRANKTCAYNIG